jgi:hypothetical protein
MYNESVGSSDRGEAMKLEFLADGSKDCPLIRLYRFTQAEVERLHRLVGHMAAGDLERIATHDLPFVEAIENCELEFVVTRWDQAIAGDVNRNRFSCGFTAGTWDNVAGLMEPFMDGARGFQWLAGLPGGTHLLLTYSGQW